MENMDIQIIKSRRRTVSIEVHTDGSVILRAPNRMTKKELDIFIDKHMYGLLLKLFCVLIL